MDFDALVKAHKDAVYRQMIRVCGNHEDAEDVLIEALLSAYRNLHQLRNAAAFRAWLRQIAKRVCWRLKDKQALSPLMQLSVLEDDGHGIVSPDLLPDEQLAQQEMKAFFLQAINSLPEDSRNVYQLRDIEQRPGIEVAKTLNISVPNMKSRLHRARALVRKYLDASMGAP